MALRSYLVSAPANLLDASSYAEEIFKLSAEAGAIKNVHSAFNLKATPSATTVASGASSDDLNTLLNNVGTAPGATTVVTVPAAPVTGDAALVQNVQTLDSYIAVLTALVMYNSHPQMYDLSDKQQAAQFVIDLANARNFVVTGGTIKAIPMYLPMGEASTQTINKSTTSADLHLDLLTAMFGSLGLPAAVLTEMDGILTEVADSLKSLQLTFTDQTQTLNHLVSFYHLVPVTGSNPVINQMNVDFIYIQMEQNSWKASIGKSSISNFNLNVTMTRTTATMSAGIVAANTSNIVNSLMQLTTNDATTISKLTKMKGIKT
ncbi:hypothetical protein [Runella sp.]|uniref:hypothetical protein n=1 Tax=Runella sp. TaxID=1960881 RepID=UPI003D0B3DED